MSDLYIIIPAYNEEENIEGVIDSWYPIIEKYGSSDNSRLVIINDGSKDNTYEAAKKKEEKYPLLTVLTKENSGHASTCMYGYRYALDQGAGLIFQTDSDGQTLPSDFDPFIREIECCDVVMGVRHKRGDGFGRLVISRVLSMVVKSIFHVTVPDSNVPFRLMKRDALKKALLYVPTDYLLAQVVLSVVFQKLHMNVHYLPISFVSREQGNSMYNISKFFGIGFNALKEFTSINRDIDAKIKKDANE